MNLFNTILVLFIFFNKNSVCLFQNKLLKGLWWDGFGVASGSLSVVCCWVSFSPRCSRAGKNALQQRSLEGSMGGQGGFAGAIRIIYSFSTIVFQCLYVESFFWWGWKIWPNPSQCFRNPCAAGFLLLLIGVLTNVKFWEQFFFFFNYCL